MLPVSMTLIEFGPTFQGRSIFEIKYVKNTTRKNHSYHWTEVVSDSSNDVISSDLEWPLFGFQGHSTFQGECVKNNAF